MVDAMVDTIEDINVDAMVDTMEDIIVDAMVDTMNPDCPQKIFLY